MKKKYRVYLAAFFTDKEIEIEVDVDSNAEDIDILENIFKKGQGFHIDNDGYMIQEEMGHRSVSVGDVVFLTDKIYRCASLGWKELLDLDEYLDGKSDLGYFETNRDHKRKAEVIAERNLLELKI